MADDKVCRGCDGHSDPHPMAENYCDACGGTGADSNDFADVDWERAKAAQKEMEAAGLYPILMLTADDVRCALGNENLSDAEAAAALHTLRRRHEFDWSEMIRLHVELEAS